MSPAPGIVLSIFPGIDLLGAAFEAEGFCVMRGPDLLWGGDVRRFNPPAGHVWGVIGGPPCQDFSQARMVPPAGHGRKMLGEFRRVVRAAQPAWWLMENVSRVPDFQIAGYGWQRIDVEAAWYSSIRRLRHIQFGATDRTRTLQIARGTPTPGAEPAAMASRRDGRTFREVCRLQGLPDDFELPGFTREAAKRAVGNGVPMVMGRVLARAVRTAMGLDCDGPDPRGSHRRVCRCGCGRRVEGGRRHYDASCRKRAQRRREKKFNAKAPGREGAKTRRREGRPRDEL